MEMGEDPLVKTAAKVFQDLCYNYRDSLSAGIICAGWDRKLGGQVTLRGAGRTRGLMMANGGVLYI